MLNTFTQNSESKKTTRSFISQKLKLIFSSSKAYHIASSLLFAMIFIHISASFWCILLQFDDVTWLSSIQTRFVDYRTFSLFRQYLLAVYYVITTITTVGYGDISPASQGALRSPSREGVRLRDHHVRGLDLHELDQLLHRGDDQR
jgi:hypothetical protein